jgi:hypothetical protein
MTMISISQLTELLGWASLINISYLLLATILIATLGDKLAAIHRRIFNLDEADLGPMYFNFLANYKIVTLVFMVAPYLALKIIGQ